MFFISISSCLKDILLSHSKTINNVTFIHILSNPIFNSSFFIFLSRLKIAFQCSYLLFLQLLWCLFDASTFITFSTCFSYLVERWSVFVFSCEILFSRFSIVSANAWVKKYLFIAWHRPYGSRLSISFSTIIYALRNFWRGGQYIRKIKYFMDLNPDLKKLLKAQEKSKKKSFWKMWTFWTSYPSLILLFFILSMMFLLFCAYASICKLFIVSSYPYTLHSLDTFCIIWENFSQFSFLFSLLSSLTHSYLYLLNNIQYTMPERKANCNLLLLSLQPLFTNIFMSIKNIASRACELNTSKVLLTQRTNLMEEEF